MGSWGQDHVSRKINWFFHNKNGIFYTNLRILWYLKSYAQSMVLLDVFIIHLHSKRKLSKITKRDCPATVTQYCSLLRAGHNQNRGSLRINYFFLTSQRIILENHGFRPLSKSRFTREKKQAISHSTGKKLGHSRITKTPFTTLKCRSFFRLMS